MPGEVGAKAPHILFQNKDPLKISAKPTRQFMRARLLQASGKAPAMQRFFGKLGSCFRMRREYTDQIAALQQAR